MIKILGIDPGTRNTGYALLELSPSQIICRDYGLIQSKKPDFADRIYEIYSEIKSLCQQKKPNHLAIEKVFLGKNPETAFKLGHIFALCRLESQNQGIEFFEYASRFVKKSVTFSGKASKELVQKFVQNFFSLPPKSSLDATDALAVALCHAKEYKRHKIHKNIQRADL